MKIETLINMVDSMLTYVGGETFSDLQTVSNALEKQIPKEPTKRKVGKVTEYWCFKCGAYIDNGYDMRLSSRGDYCKYCGQKIDWRV